jgi:hypothetical protein
MKLKLKPIVIAVHLACEQIGAEWRMAQERAAAGQP